MRAPSPTPTRQRQSRRPKNTQQQQLSLKKVWRPKTASHRVNPLVSLLPPLQQSQQLNHDQPNILLQQQQQTTQLSSSTSTTTTTSSSTPPRLQNDSLSTKQQQQKDTKTQQQQQKEQKEQIVSLGPPQTFHATADFVVTAPTSNSFTVPNCLTDISPHSGRIVRNTLHIRPTVKDFAEIHLTEGGERIRDTPNAGGNSVMSEVLSYELLRCMYGAELLRTEMELEYWPLGGKITDYSIELFRFRFFF